jgi:alpha-glucosidase (family GH31 glycosyl hydrolase)
MTLHPPVDVNDADATVRLEILPGEHWWGGDSSDGYRMPFTDGYHVDLREPGDNQAMPLLVSSRGRYLWSEDPLTIELDGSILLARRHGRAPIEVGGGEGSLRGGFVAAARHFAADGRRPAAAMFTAPQYNLWIETLFQPTQNAVLQYAEQALEHGFPAGVLIIDDMWSESYGDWRFHSGRFPEPRAMTEHLHELGFAVMLWIVPLVTPDSPTYRSLAGRGFLIRDESGEPAIGSWWNGRSAAVDLLNPDALAWLHSKLQSLCTNFDVDGFKFDGGDASFYRGVRLADPQRYTTAWNTLATTWAMNELRAAWKAAGLPLTQRQRDKAHSWHERDGLASLIPNGLAQGLSGHAFTCPDMIGGGDYLAFPGAGTSPSFDPELFVRSAQCQALFPMMQFSAAPWRLLDRHHLNLCVDAAQLHVAHGDEILGFADAAARTGEPIQRHLAYVFPGSGYERIRDQSMIGDELMVAPVIAKGQTRRSVVLPPGDWIADDGAWWTGPARVEVDAPLSRLPRFRRYGA